nr:hypothetical transcript [Hymenolepis microstoma]
MHGVECDKGESLVIQHGELSKSKSKRVTPSESAADQKAQENLRAIFGNLTTIEPRTESVQKLSVPTTLEIPPAVGHNDSFGMTNAQFVRRVSMSSDIDSPENEKPQTPPKKRISSNLSSQSQKSNSKFMELFKRTSYSPNPTDTSKSFSTLTVTSSGDAPTESSNRLSVGGRAAKFFLKMRKNSGEVSGSQSSLASVSVPETPPIPKPEKVRLLPPISPASTSTSSRDESRLTTLNTGMRGGIQSTNEANFATSEQLPKSPEKPSHHEADNWSPSVDSNPFTFRSGSTSAVDKSSEESKKPSYMGALARKIVSAPKSYHGLTKKWIPPINGHMITYGWGVLEGCRLNFYANKGAHTLETVPLAIFNVHNSTVHTCSPKTSKSHSNVLQINLEDGTEMLLAANSPENCNQWYDHLKAASQVAPDGTFVRGYSGLSRSSGSWRDRGSHGTWTLPRSGSLKRRDSDESSRHGTWGRLTRRKKDSINGKK